MLALEDDLLRVGDDDVEARAIQRIERGTRFFEVVEAQVRGQEIDVLWRHHAGEVEGFDFLQRLQHRFVRREHQRVMAVARVLLEFVAQQELIEDAGRHEDGFACAHRQREDVVRVGARVLAHRRKHSFVLILCNFIKHTYLLLRMSGNNPSLATPCESALFLEPLLKNILNPRIAKKLLEKNIGFQRLELRLAQENLGVLVGVVEIEEFAGQFLVMLPNRASIALIELPEELEEGEVKRRADRLGCALSRHWPRSLPTTPTAGR